MRSILVLELPSHSSATPTTAMPMPASVAPVSAPTPTPDNVGVSPTGRTSTASEDYHRANALRPLGMRTQFGTPYGVLPRDMVARHEVMLQRDYERLAADDDTWRAFHPDTVDAPPAPAGLHACGHLRGSCSQCHQCLLDKGATACPTCEPACTLGLKCDERGDCAADHHDGMVCGRPGDGFDWLLGPVLRNTVDGCDSTTDRNTDPIDNSGDDGDVVGGIERSTLMLMQREDGELQAELSLWWDEPGANPKVPDVVHWGPLSRLAETLRRHGVTAAGLVRAMVTAGLPMPTIERAARAMA